MKSFSFGKGCIMTKNVILCMVVLAMGMVSTAPAADTMLARWTFDTAAASPHVQDVTGNGYDLTCSQSSVNVQAGYIAGSAAAVRTRDPFAYWAVAQPTLPDPNDMKLDNGGTIVVWFKLPTTGVTMDYSRALSIQINNENNRQLELTFMKDGRIRFIKPNAAVYSIDGYNDDRWHQFVGVYDPTQNYSAVYVDGQVVRTHDALVGSYRFNGAYCFVANNKDYNRQFNGDLDDIRVYNYALSDSQIEDLYYGDLPLFVDAGADRFAPANEPYLIEAAASLEFESFQWTQLSGPGTVQFSDASVLSPTAQFDHQGTYELQIEAFAGGSSKTDTVLFRVYDTAYNQLLAHWDFDAAGEDPNIIDMTGNGYDTVCSRDSLNVIPGYIDGSAEAVDLASPNGAYWTVKQPGAEPNTTAPDPEIQDLSYGTTFSVWFKLPAAGVPWDFTRALQIDKFNLELNFMRDGRARLLIPGAAIYSAAIYNDNQWHQFVGVFDPVNNYSAIYMDGQQTTTHTAPIYNYSFTGEGAVIANNSDHSRQFNGALDDIKLYNYALSGGEIAALYQDERPIVVDAGADAFAPVDEPLAMEATIYKGYVSALWTQESGPGTAVFSDPTVEDPNVTFDRQGVYDLKLTAENSRGATAEDTVRIFVYDTAYRQLLAHWNFDDVSADPNLVADLTGNGYDGVFSALPNIIEGHVDGGVSAIRFRDPASYVTISEPTGLAPEVQELSYGATLSLWFRLPETGVGQYARAISIVPNVLELTFLSDGTVRWLKYNDAVYSQRTLNDNQWHHFVGIYDPINNYSAVYVDGLLERVMDGDILQQSFIGTGSRIANSSLLDRQYTGDLDDVRIYNYALDEADVLNLAAMGKRPLYVDPSAAGQDTTYVMRRSEPLDLIPAVVDDGDPAPATFTWSLLSGPELSGPGEAIFADPSAAETTVTFTQEGDYELQLEADNGAQTVSGTLTVTATEPTLEAADPDILLVGDTMYVYPTGGGARKFYAYSSTTLLTTASEWTRHGPILDFEDIAWLSEDHHAWAPGMIEKDGLYYMYFSAGSAFPEHIGVAVSSSPEGPFVDARGSALLTSIADEFDAIDAMAFQDPVSGKTYLYAGGLRESQLRVYELNNDMISIAQQITIDQPVNYGEGPFMHYHDGTYYLSYSKGTGYAYGDYSVFYSTASTPYGPWTYQGQILASDATFKGPGHHSFFHNQALDEWYIFYHRWCNRQGDGPYGGVRRIGIEKIEYDAGGLIQPIVMTEYGVGADPLVLGSTRIADLDQSGEVDCDDLAYMAGVWLTADTLADISPLGGDGIVDLYDFAMLASQWMDSTD